jgi:hypothetical protein
MNELGDVAKLIGLLEQILARGPLAPSFMLTLGDRQYGSADLPKAITYLRNCLTSEYRSTVLPLANQLSPAL